MNWESRTRIQKLCEKRKFKLIELEDCYQFEDDSTVVNLFINDKCLAGIYSEKEKEEKKEKHEKYSKIGSEKKVDKFEHTESKCIKCIGRIEGAFYKNYKEKMNNKNLLVVRIKKIDDLNKNIAFREIKKLETMKNRKVFMVQYIGYTREEIMNITEGESWFCRDMCGGVGPNFDIIESVYNKTTRSYDHLITDSLETADYRIDNRDEIDYEWIKKRDYLL